MTTQCKVLIILIIVCAILPRAVKTEWQYLIVRFNSTTTNEEILSAHLRPVRITPGLYGLTGTIKVGVPVDNTFMFQMNAYRSTTGNGNYAMTPIRIQNVPFEVFINMFYRPIAMMDLQNCSNLPLFEEKFKGTVGPVDFHMDRCIIGSSNMPTFIRTGFYKIIFKVTSPSVALAVEMVSQVL